MPRRILLGLAVFFTLVSCGVKTPTVAPVHHPEPNRPHLDCSPQDENCDKTDPNYRRK